jgi:DNA-binding NarL/FixJ family response regulator
MTEAPAPGTCNDTCIHVVLADDHEILRHGLSLLLSMQPEIHIVGEARTGREALEVVAALRPQVVVMDISMPDIDGLEACRLIREQYPETQVLILTMHEGEGYFLQALRVGASGYLIKKVAPAELQQAIITVAQGGAFLYPGLAKVLIQAYLKQPTMTEQHDEGESIKAQQDLKQELAVLTPRELEVLTMVAAGKTSQEIADQLILSVKTVQAHRANVMDKLGLHDITQLVRFALRHKLIPER